VSTDQHTELPCHALELFHSEHAHRLQEDLEKESDLPQTDLLHEIFDRTFSEMVKPPPDERTPAMSRELLRWEHPRFLQFYCYP
jgi:hypothetical protein